MSNNFKIVDLDTWKRKPQYDYFVKFQYPIVSVSSRIDVTNLVEYCENNNLKFFTVLLYIVAKNINNIEEFKTRIVDDKIVVFDNIDPGFVVINKAEDILTCKSVYNNDFKAFYTQSRKDLEYKKNLDKNEEFSSDKSLDCFYVSCLPWIDMRSVINPYDFNNVGQSVIPRITWGKYFKNSLGNYEMGFDVSAHHAFLDGFHFAKLINGIENDIKKIDEILK